MIIYGGRLIAGFPPPTVDEMILLRKLIELINENSDW